MPLGFCNPPVCWNVTFDFTQANLLLMHPQDVANWATGKKRPLNNFPVFAKALKDKLNA